VVKVIDLHLVALCGRDVSCTLPSSTSTQASCTSTLFSLQVHNMHTHACVLVRTHVCTHTHYYDPWHPPCSVYVPDSLFPQSPSFLWSTAWLAPSISYSIHFFTQSLSSFAAHAHTITTCFALVLRLCRLILVSLS